MARRIKMAHTNPELRNARVFVARKVHECTLCGTLTHPTWIQPREMYVRVSEIRNAVCQAHFTAADIIEDCE